MTNGCTLDLQNVSDAMEVDSVPTSSGYKNWAVS